jgi:TatD DNase family protein
LIDSHAHLDDERFDADRDEVIRRAQGAGVGLIVCPAGDLAGSRRVLDLAHKHECILAAVGMDRDGVAELNDDSLAELKQLAQDERCVAIGEIGLDYYYDKLPRDVQKAGFEAQVKLAGELELPVIVHCREAFDDCLDILERHGARGVMHCFSGDAEIAHRCCDLGLMISFAGTVTFKKADELREAARVVPSEHLMIETDCPYLAPVPVRGQRNEPAFVTHVADRLADVLGLSVADVDRITTTNARILFGLPVNETPAIVYPIRDALYVNLTNRCTNHCLFCPRSTNPRVKGHWLGMTEPDEPDAAAVIAAIGDPTRYEAIVFCGFGEPTLRLDVMLDVAKWVKAQGGTTRVNTNGSGDLIAGEPVAPRLKGLIDVVSVSLNTADAAQYEELCRPEFGERMFPAMMEFIRSAKASGLNVMVTALDYPDVDVGAVERMAAELGVTFRPRTYKHLG